MKNILFLSVLASFLVIISCKKDEVDNSNIFISANSVDALAQAIEDIDDGGIITLASGVHNESESIRISKKIKIKGEDGAVVIFNTEPSPFGTPIETGFYILDIDGVSIENLHIQNVNDLGGTAFFVENSNETVLELNKIEKHQFAIVTEMSNDVRVVNNTMEGVEKGGFGLVVINGKRAKVETNNFSNWRFGAWIADDNGTINNNNSFKNNHIGIIPCAIKDSLNTTTPRGDRVGSIYPATGWVIQNNHFENNDWFGILIFDGSKNCRIEDNTFEDNGLAPPSEIGGGGCTNPNSGDGADIEIGQATGALACCLPCADATYDNYIRADSSTTIIDCGVNSDIEGGFRPPGANCL